MNGIEIIIGADLVPTASNLELFAAGDAAELLGRELLDVFYQADFRIFNLEVPLTDVPTPISKPGGNLIAPTSAVNGLKMIKADLLGLANNHILDQGEPGLSSTLQTLHGKGIGYVGAGSDLLEAARPVILAMDGIRTGIYACAEHEFSIAAAERAGANPFDPLESLDHIAKLKETCEHVIVLYHGGKEHYRYPSPALQKTCRKLVEKGAGLVVCQHSHCIGAFEKWQGGTIVYGQGNFLFDRLDVEFRRTSLLIRAKLTQNDMAVEFIPIVKHGNVVRLADPQQSAAILESFAERSRQILQPGFIQAEYERFAAEMINYYLTSFGGDGLMFRIMNKLGGHDLVRKSHSSLSLARVLNYVRCEAHRELLMTGLNLEKEKQS